MVAAFALMVTLVPTVAREQTVIHDGATISGGRDASGTGADAAPPSLPGSGSLAATGPGTATPRGARTVIGHTSACSDRRQQVPGDPYSPPCAVFTGDNGGATSRGVSRDTIVVAYRQTADPDLSATVAKLVGSDIIDSPEDTLRTFQGLVDYFNTHFQLYGRKIRLVPYQGQGRLTKEFLGAGQENANADAIRVGSEMGAFADLTGLTEPYAEALARQHVVNFGAPYMSRRWFLDHRPYSWSMLTDCTILAQNSADYLNKRILGRPARYAGGDLQGRARKLAIIAPENPEYQQCLHDDLDVLHSAGNGSSP
jgi:hypothetical protein